MGGFLAGKISKRQFFFDTSELYRRHQANHSSDGQRSDGSGYRRANSRWKNLVRVSQAGQFSLEYSWPDLSAAKSRSQGIIQACASASAGISLAFATGTIQHPV